MRPQAQVTAKPGPAQRQMGWRLDRWTAARVRASAIWKHHPEFTAKQVIRKLGPEHSVRVPWVQKIMRECWRVSADITRSSAELDGGFIVPGGGMRGGRQTKPSLESNALCVWPQTLFLVLVRGAGPRVHHLTAL